MGGKPSHTLAELVLREGKTPKAIGSMHTRVWPLTDTKHCSSRGLQHPRGIPRGELSGHASTTGSLHNKSDFIGFAPDTLDFRLQNCSKCGLIPNHTRFLPAALIPLQFFSLSNDSLYEEGDGQLPASVFAVPSCRDEAGQSVIQEVDLSLLIAHLRPFVILFETHWDCSHLHSPLSRCTRIEEISFLGAILSGDRAV